MSGQSVIFLFAGVLLLGLSSLWLWLALRRSSNSAKTGRRTALLLATLLPLASIGLYLVFGNIQLVREPWRALPSNEETLVDSITMAKERLKENPNNVELLLAVARGELLLQNFSAAIELYRRAQAQLGNTAEVVLPLADALTIQNNGQVPGQAVTLLEDFHNTQPSNPDALWMLAIAAEQREDFTTALGYWQNLLPLAHEADPQLAEQIAERIDKLQNPLSISIQIESARLPGSDEVLFISAHALGENGANGASPMPVAAKRLQEFSFPLTLTLSNLDSLQAGNPLSDHAQLEIRAGISADGQAGSATSKTSAVWNSQQQTPVRLTLP